MKSNYLAMKFKAAAPVENHPSLPATPASELCSAKLPKPRIFHVRYLMLGLICFFMSSCSDEGSTAQEPKVDQATAMEVATPAETPAEVQVTDDDPASIEESLGLETMATLRTGDLEVMKEHRLIRVLTVYGLGRYYLDGPQEKGLTYELFKMFEKSINEKMKRGHLKVHVIFIPVSRDELVPALIEGRGDIIAAGMTITPEREKLIEFTNPVSKSISEILVTGPSAPSLGNIDDLSGKSIYVRASSSYRSSLDELNRTFADRGMAPVSLEDATEVLEDEDLLEMVNAGLIDWAVVDDYKARVFANVFGNITARDDIVFRKGGKIAYAVRKNNPQLKSELNEFMKSHKQGTLTGNILINRYIRDFDWAKNALKASDYKRFHEVADIFEIYGKRYGVDYLMVAAQGYQESGLDQSARSPAGAIGIMQLLPSTASDPNVGIPDISTADANIHAGIKYLDFIRNRYFSDPEIDLFNRTMFAFAAYNAGPARVRKLRDKASEAGYDPNVWFDNVEVFAAKDIGSETVQYVANILKYYIAYRLIIKQQLKRDKARKGSGVG